MAMRPDLKKTKAMSITNISFLKYLTTEDTAVEQEFFCGCTNGDLFTSIYEYPRSLLRDSVGHSAQPFP